MQYLEKQKKIDSWKHNGIALLVRVAARAPACSLTWLSNATRTTCPIYKHAHDPRAPSFLGTSRRKRNATMQLNEFFLEFARSLRENQQR